MNQQEQSLTEDKMRVEIARRAAQTIQIEEQMRWKMPAYLISYIAALIAVVIFFR